MVSLILAWRRGVEERYSIIFASVEVTLELAPAALGSVGRPRYSRAVAGAEWTEMRCVGCGSAAITERPERTGHGYKRFGCRKQFNKRSGTLLNRTQYPSDVVALVVLWQLRFKLSLRDLPEMFAQRGMVFSYEAVRA